MKKLTAVLMTLLVVAFMVLMGVGVTHVPNVSGTWTHGEPEQWTWLDLVEEDGRVTGDLSGNLKEAMTRDSSAFPLHVAGSWDNPYLELELEGFYYQEGVCSIAGEVDSGDRSLLAALWARWRSPTIRLFAVIQCPEAEPLPMVFEKVEE